MRRQNSTSKRRVSAVEDFDDVNHRESKRREAFRSKTHLDHWDIKQEAIQILHTDVAEKQSLADQRAITKLVFFEKALHPNGNFRRSFDLVTVVWVVVLAFMIPFEIGFGWYKMPTIYKTFSSLLDCWFALDIILNFRTGYILHGTVVMDDSKIIKHYLGTWFAFDLLGTIPFELLLNGRTSSRKSLKLVKYFKIPKLMRLSRILKYLHEHKQVYDIFEVFIFVLSFLHFGSCIWARILNPCPDEGLNLDYNDEICAQEKIFHAYTQVLHVSAVMMLGISNTHIMLNPENIDVMRRSMESTTSRSKIFLTSTIFMVGGLFLVALLMSKMNVYIMGKMQGSATFQQRNDRVKHEMEYYGIPDELQKQVKAFYRYVWVHQRQYDDRIALLSDDQMSTDLQRKLALHLYKDVVSHISLFSQLDDLMLGEICLSLRTRIFLPKDMILFKGDVGRELFIISKGVVEVLRDDLPVSKRYLSPPILLRKGSFFGEIALIMETRRTCSVQARTMCEVNVLHQDTFDLILNRHPAFARRMNELVVSRSIESCLERAKSKGIDVKIAKADMERAVTIVEQNMYEGLKRRTNAIFDNSNNMSDKVWGTVTNNDISINAKGISESRHNDNINEIMDVSMPHNFDAKHNNLHLKHCISFDNIPPTSTISGSIANTQTCTRNQNKQNSYLKLSQNCSAGVMPTSNLNLDSNKTQINGSLYVQRYDSETSRSDIEEGESARSSAKGHFIPGQSIPLDKVRVSILEPPNDTSSSLTSTIIRTVLPKDVEIDDILIDSNPICKDNEDIS